MKEEGVRRARWRRRKYCINQYSLALQRTQSHATLPTDAGGTSVKAVLHQFLHCYRQTQNHLSATNMVNGLLVNRFDGHFPALLEHSAIYAGNGRQNVNHVSSSNSGTIQH